MWTAIPQTDEAGAAEEPGLRSRVQNLRAWFKSRRILFGVALFLIFLTLVFSPNSESQDAYVGVSDQKPSMSASDRVEDAISGGEPWQVSEETLSGRGLQLSNTIKENCPKWSRNFTDKFINKCGFWFEKYQNWLTKSTKGNIKPPAGYLCQDESECHGLGDRLAGIQAAFTVSLETLRPLRIEWEGFDKLFSTCVLQGSMAADWSRPIENKGCVVESGSCGGDITSANRCGGSIFYENSDRGCLPPAACGRGRIAFPETLNAANIYGCGLRSLLEPKEHLLNLQIPFRDGGNGQKRISVLEAAELMTKYFVIGIHFRLGDGAAFLKPWSRNIVPEQRKYFSPFQCASLLQSYLEGRQLRKEVQIVKAGDRWYSRDESDDEFKVDGRPVRWFLASDSNALREMAAQLFGDKLLMMETRPTHIALAQDRSNALANTFAEWYLLGMSDVMIVNRIGGKNLYRGRLSSYSKTTWVYQLKNLFYDAGTCRRRQIILDGTWKVAPRECSKPATFHHKLTQPHLETLENTLQASGFNVTSYNETFPQFWIDKNTIKTFEPSLDVIESEETPDESPEDGE